MIGLELEKNKGAAEQPMHIHVTEVYNSYSKQNPCSQCSWGHPPTNPVTIDQLERLLDAKIAAHKEWSKSRIYATEINGVENLTERVRRDILERESFDISLAADNVYEDAIKAYVKQKKGND